MSCNHQWSEECYDVVPSQVCVRCNAFQVEEEHAELVRDAFKRGAAAMRETCARWMSEREGISQWVYDDALSALPTPEEP